MIVVHNLYYAQPGRADEVEAHRRRATEVRRRLGLPAGRSLRRREPPGDLPDVVWECEFEDTAAHDRDMAVRAASAEFEAVRAHMRTLIRRFERVVWEVVG